MVYSGKRNEPKLQKKKTNVELEKRIPLREITSRISLQ
jgi:hypothetical protein